MERLSHRGPDGKDVLTHDRIAFGHWHFWTTPEEQGEKQPLSLEGLPFTLVFDGRLDNRSELLRKLGLTTKDDLKQSDASLVLRAYAQWGSSCFEHFNGEFALVLFDEQRDELFCARDALGDRTLFYAFYDTLVVIASEPWAVDGAVGDRYSINESAIAHYFAFSVPEDGQTMMSGIYELVPAHALKIGNGKEHIWRYWEPDPEKKIRYQSDQEYAEHFLTLLEDSVRCRMRANGQVGILMSGGLDSTSVASLAARMISPQVLTTISYVFNDFPDCDERIYINALKEKYNLRSIQIPCDDLWPYKDWTDWPENKNHPEGNPYRLLKERAYQRGQSEGIRVLLTGGFGDHLYDGVESWIVDLLEDGHIVQALNGFWQSMHHLGLRHSLNVKSLRRIAKRMIGKTLNGKRWQRKRISYPWLSPSSVNAVGDHSQAWGKPGFEEKANLLGLRAAQSSSAEIAYANRYELELRHPYRDRRLVEFMLALPAYQFYSSGVYKYILRNSMRELLPEVICTRGRPTSLISFFNFGSTREKQLLEANLHLANTSWHKYVNQDWVMKNWNLKSTPEKDGAHVLVPWLCMSYDAWYKMIESDHKH